MAHLLDGRDDVRVGAAAADVAVHRVLNVSVSGANVFLEDCHGRHNLTRGAIATLVAIVFNEGGLHGVKVIGLTDSFDGGDLVVRVHDGEGETGVDAASINVDGARSALPVIAALLGTRRNKVLSEAVEEGGARIEPEGVRLAVDLKRRAAVPSVWIPSVASATGADLAANTGGAEAARPAAPRCERKDRRVTRFTGT